MCSNSEHNMSHIIPVNYGFNVVIYAILTGLLLQFSVDVY